MIIGHDNVKQNLVKYFESRNLDSNTFVFSGPSGVGKSHMAKYFSANLLDGTMNFEDVPKLFKNIENNSCYGYFYLKCDENNKVGIDDVRDFIKKSVLSSSSKRKIFLIDSVDELNLNCQNGLLKSLEDLAHGNIFILICHDKTKILKTILSRSIQLNFSKLKENEIDIFFKNDKNVDEKEFKIVKKIADGSIGYINKIYDENLLKVFYDFNELLINSKDFFVENFNYIAKDSMYLNYCIKYYVFELYNYINKDDDYIFDNSKLLHEKFSIIFNNEMDIINHIEYLYGVYNANKTLNFNNKMIFLDIFKSFLK